METRKRDALAVEANALRQKQLREKRLAGGVNKFTAWIREQDFEEASALLDPLIQRAKDHLEAHGKYDPAKDPRKKRKR